MDGQSLETLLKETTNKAVEYHKNLGEFALSGEEKRDGANPERKCSRAGFLRSLAAMEARYLKPWELCPDCNGDLPRMFDIRCF